MILAVIQARMSSSRLPGKVLKEVLGKPLIEHMLNQVRHCRTIEQVMVATSVNPSDDPLAEFLKGKGVAVFRGSEDDVLERFYLAARSVSPRAVVRLTGDCPLVDPLICDDLVRTYLSNDVDFVHTAATYAEGADCEILSFSALEKAHREARLKSEREHLTMYLHNHPELFRKMTLENATDDSRFRITVDEPEDFTVVRAVIEGLYGADRPFYTITDVKAFLESHPQIMRINSGIVRNEGLIMSLQSDGEAAGAGNDDHERCPHG